MEVKFPMLTAEQIEVKVKQIGKPKEGTSAVSLLLYKTARTDMDMLDQVVGPMGWETDYKEIKGNLYCGIGIYDGEKVVWKWDCGIESRTDGDGNEKKGEASDAFKRAGFKWGIGRELYTGPRITAFLPAEVDGNRVVLTERHHKFDGFTVADIGYEDGKIVRLRIDDSKGVAVFTYPRSYAKDAGLRKLDEANTDKAPDKAPEKAPDTTVYCERCQKAIKGIKLADGSLMRAEQIIGLSQKDFNATYCYRCQCELHAKQGETA